ncbi:MAG: response regulator [Candidatus Omnitrophota bacterium]
MARKGEKSKAAGKLKILVVDDQIGISSFLFDFFSKKGYDVLQARNAKKAIKLVEKEKPPIVLLDIRLGWGKNGVDVLKEIKELEPKTKVIMMTGVKDEEIMNRTRDLGADDYITKPFSLSYLEKVVALKILKLQIESIGESEV